MKLIGLSLSLLIADIIKGRIDENDVNVIVAATKARGDDDIDTVIDLYKKSYWDSDPDRAEALARKWFQEDKIEQPLLSGLLHPGAGNGWWKDADEFMLDTCRAMVLIPNLCD